MSKTDSEAATKRMNIVLIMTDTQGANLVGCYGKPELRTPCLDRLAEEGVRFERAYTTCPVCTPARSAIFSGLYPSKNGCFTNNLALAGNVKHMGQRLSDAGYRAAYVGKWHLDGHDYFGDGVCPEGWDPGYWYDGLRYLEELSDEEIALWRGGLKSYGDLVKHGVTREFTWGGRVTDRAVQFLEKAKEEGRPFCLAVSYDEPHGPCVCPPEFVEPFLDYEWDVGPAAEDTLEGKPRLQREWAKAYQGVGSGPFRRKLKKSMFMGCNSFVDAEIGRVIDTVDRLGLGENTMVVYTSDHGDMLGAHGLSSKGPAMYEEIARIPLIMRLPGKRRAGRIVEEAVSHVDLLPTLLDYAGLERPPILDGRSLRGMLEGEAGEERAGALLEFHRHSLPHGSFGGFVPIRAWVEESWKLVINLHDRDELYDLENDPHELRNCIDDADAAEARDGLHDRLLRRMNELRDPFRGPCWAERPWRRGVAFPWRDDVYRAKPDDGYGPPTRLYGTGQPDEW